MRVEYLDLGDFEAEAAVLAVAAGTWKEGAAAEWLRGHLTPPSG